MTAIYGNVYMGNRFVPDDGVVVRRARQAVTLALKKKQILGQPIARFDPNTRKVYLEYSDGTCVDCGMATRGRYSEWRK
mgnify:CR=1 FL=1